jgi:chromosomal replication initiation ATPase DnaA
MTKNDASRRARLVNKAIEKKQDQDKACLIQEIVSAYRGFTVDEVSVRSRKTDVRLTRQIIMFCAKRRTSLSFKEIGQLFDFDHTTVMHSIQVIQADIMSDFDLRQEIDIIIGIIDGVEVKKIEVKVEPKCTSKLARPAATYSNKSPYGLAL